MFKWLKKWLHILNRAREANRRGWRSLGPMFGEGDTWSADRWGREVRRSNRLYRLARGKSPWLEQGVERKRENTKSSEESTPLISFECWGNQIQFGNLIKPGGVNALFWYTVLIEDKLFAFDAASLTASREKTIFDSDISTSVKQAKNIVENKFRNLTDFSVWIKRDGYVLN